MKRKNTKEKEHNFDSRKELTIYQYLCGSPLKKRVIKRIDEDKRFKTYSAWRTYVEGKYSNAEEKQLEEFRRYLTYRKRTITGLSSWWNTCFIPLLIAVIGAVLLNNLEEKFPSINMNSVKYVVEVLLQVKLMYKIVIALFGVLVILLYAVVYLMIPASMFFMMYQILKTTIENEQESAFYEDYIEIIVDLIKARTSE